MLSPEMYMAPDALPNLRQVKGRRARVARALITWLPWGAPQVAPKSLRSVPIYSDEHGWTRSTGSGVTGSRYLVLASEMGSLKSGVLGLIGPDSALPMEAALQTLHSRACEPLSRLPLRTAPIGIETSTKYTSADELARSSRDAELPEALQDLADELIIDITEACHAIDNPSLYYPGVGDEIEPVSDEHVRLVTAAFQRELERERRPYRTGPPDRPSVRRPAVQLSSLPWEVQRAMAERRRLRYKQWGIGRLDWERNEWSLWNVPEDPEWMPRAEH